MAADTRTLRAHLERISELSALQSRLLSENRVGELLRAQSEREAVMKEALEAGLSQSTLSDDPGMKDLAMGIISSDKTLSMKIESELSEIRNRLKKLSSGKKAMKAYTSR